jgi:hypothetical protein
MIKNHFVLYAVLGGLAIFACTIPTGVEIRANPQMTLPASVDFSEKFAEGIRNGFSGNDMKMYDCISVKDPQTFLISVTLPSLPNPLGNVLLSGGSGTTPRPPSDMILATNKANHPLNPGGINPPISIPLSGLNDFMGDGFKFRRIESKLYVSDSNNTGLVEKLKVELYNGDDLIPPTIGDAADIGSGQSGLEPGQSDYLPTELPAGGNTIDIAPLLDSKQEVELIYYISLKGGAGTIPAAWDNAQIKVELLIWLPLDFKADDLSGGAVIKFPDMFEDGKDLFGRTSAEDSMLKMMSRIRVEIGMTSPAFKGGIMKMEGITDCPLESNAIVLDLGSTDIEYINTHYPFSPDIGIWFRNGEGPTIPRGLGVISLGFDADVNYKL